MAGKFESRPTKVVMTHYLQDSIFDALHKKLLAAVQLSIIVDEANPSNVIETYTFSFTYTSNANVVGRRLAEMVLSGPDGKQVTIQDARSGLWSLVRQFLAINNFLPNLPGGFCRTKRTRAARAHLDIIRHSFLDMPLVLHARLSEDL